VGQSPVVATAARNAFREQQRLRTLLGHVEAAFVRSPVRTGVGPDEIAARLDTLRGKLMAHFEEEERAQLFETIETHAPQHAGECTRLRGDHTQLVKRLDGLRVATPEGRRTGGWVVEVRRFLDDLLKHEDREAELLQLALDGGPAAED
jgi:hypothetical protein